ncbi:MAG: GNAT family N-acetyltransferase [Deltaproteobacteria bacterium]|uniref:GNAT family N-acetyltransferase n=1 Tax=Candidatus Desulfacyla euxinica TaxID=2841693 RepID=A0A8J6T3I7_9DELT|nr:GNAT family N-acetyltransferase [Candidatus Desulfacyla euxinica]MBL7216149.1 GNAT family N-acetyltransferase [Desulfobacteraceae bacterium]
MDELVENLQIRKIKAEDASDIGSIQAAITKSPTNIDFRQIIEDQVRKDEDVSFVAEIDGKVVGYMISYIVFGGFGLEKGAWIATLGVDPKFMGQGIGKRLAEEILEVYRKKGINDIYTSVRWDSVDLLSFFKTLGFDRSNFINLRKELDS